METNRKPHQITLVEDSRIAPYRAMTKAAQLYEEQRVVVGEGAKVVRRVLQSSLNMASFLATARYYEEMQDILQAKIQRGELQSEHCFVAEKSVMNDIVGYKLHEGVLAMAHAPEEYTLYDRSSTIALPAVMLNGVVDSENVGAIVRNCVAFGISSLIIDGTTSSPYLRRAVRVSLGAIFGLTVYHSHDIRADLTELKQTRGVQVIVAETQAHARNVATFPFPENFVLVFGSEGYGCSDEVLDCADEIIAITMQPSSHANFAVNSLNVAASSAIILHYLHQAQMLQREE